VKRWREETLSLQEEIRRCPVSLEWHARNWESKAEIDTFEGERFEGSSAYAHEQAAVRRKIKDRFQSLWSTDPFKACLEFKPGDLHMDTILHRMVVDDEEEVVDEPFSESDDDEEEEEEEEVMGGEGIMEGEEFEEQQDNAEVYNDDNNDKPVEGTTRLMEMLRELEEDREE
jgi:hypothetical protein